MGLSGVGVHEKNGVEEREIQTVVNSARTMMFHQSLHWPEYFDMRLWPFASTCSLLMELPPERIPRPHPARNIHR